MSAEKVVRGYLTEVAGPAGAEFLLEKLKEEWQAREAEKDECEHYFWRHVYDEPGSWNKCDTCDKRNVPMGI